MPSFRENYWVTSEKTSRRTERQTHIHRITLATARGPINKLYKGCSHIIHNDRQSSFEEFLEKDSYDQLSFTFKFCQTMYSKGINTYQLFFKSMKFLKQNFFLQTKAHYSVLKNTCKICKSWYTISNIGPLIWEILLNCYKLESWDLTL